MRHQGRSVTPEPQSYSARSSRQSKVVAMFRESLVLTISTLRQSVRPPRGDPSRTWLSPENGSDSFAHHEFIFVAP